jgi:hypothetical protein
MGFPHPGVECLVAQITKLLIQYGCHSGLGLKMSVSMEFLITELGTSAQLVCESFLEYGSWATHTWLQSLWEKVDKFDITVEITSLTMEPRERVRNMVHAGSGGIRFHIGPGDENSKSLLLPPGSDISVGWVQCRRKIPGQTVP